MVKAFDEAGFTDKVVWNFKCPIGGWPENPKLKEIGEYALLSLEMDLEGESVLHFDGSLG